MKNGWELNSSIQSKVMAMIFSIAAEIEKDLIRKRTVEGLQAARAKGKLLGRPKGPGKSKLDKHREEIIALLKTGSKQVYIAKRYGTSAAEPIQLAQETRSGRDQAGILTGAENRLQSRSGLSHGRPVSTQRDQRGWVKS